MNIAFDIDDSKVKRDIAAKLQNVVADEFNKVAADLLSNNAYFGTKLGPVRANIRKHVESIVLENATDEKVMADVQELYNKTYAKFYREAMTDAINRAARKQANVDVKKLLRSPIQPQREEQV